MRRKGFCPESPGPPFGDNAMRIAFAIVLTLASFFVTACGGDSRLAELNRDQILDQGRASAQPTEMERKIALIEEKFDEYKDQRDSSVGWATEVKPGDERKRYGVETDLSMLDGFMRDLEQVEPSDKIGNLRSDIRLAMIEDLRLLLRMANTEQDIYALSGFLRYAPKLDVGPDEFGTTTQELRATALRLAKIEVARQRKDPTEGNPIAELMREWQFTPQELGLTDLEVQNARESH